MRILLLVALTLASLATDVTAESRITLQVYPRIMAISQDLRVTVRVPRNDANRLLVLAWSWQGLPSGESSRQLEGAEAEVTHTFLMRDQPAGHYFFVASLYDNRGKLVAQDTLNVTGPEDR